MWLILQGLLSLLSFLTSSGQPYYHCLVTLLTVDRSSVEFYLYNIYFFCHCSLTSARLLLASLAIKQNTTEAYYRYDPYWRVIDPCGTFDRYFLTFLAIYPLCGVAFHYLIHISEPALLHGMYADVLATRDQFLELNPQFIFQSFALRSPAKCRREIQRIISLLKREQKARFTKRRLDTFPLLTDQNRIHLTWLTYFIDFQHTLARFISQIVVLLLVFYYFLRIYRLHLFRPFRILLLLIDIVGIFYILLTSFQNCIFNMYGLQLLAFVYRCCSKELDAKLNQLQAIPNRSLNSVHSQLHLAQKLSHFTAENARLLAYIVELDTTYASRGMAIFIATNFPLNVYVMTMLLFRGEAVDAVNYWIFLGIALNQIAGPILCALPMISISGAVHQSASGLLSFLAKIKLLGFKLKYCAYYERLHTEDRVTFNAGAFGRVTQRAVFQFAIIYIGFFLYTVPFITRAKGGSF